MAGPSTSLNGPQQEMAPKEPGTRNSPTQGCLGCRRVLDAIARYGWRACTLLSLFLSRHCGWLATKQTARSKGSGGVMVAAGARHGLSTPFGGAGDQGIELCKRDACSFSTKAAFFHVVLCSLGLHAHRCRPHQEHWQILSTVGQWLTSEALPFIIGGDFHSRWVRAVGAFVVAPKLATVAPSHRVVGLFFVSRDLAGACEATQISEHVAPHRPVRRLICLVDIPAAPFRYLELLLNFGAWPEHGTNSWDVALQGSQHGAALL